jgi:hypothetical protein
MKDKQILDKIRSLVWCGKVDYIKIVTSDGKQYEFSKLPKEDNNE